MSQRKSDDTAQSAGQAKPESPAAQRRRVVYWDDPDAPKPLSPEQWDHFVQEMADAGKSVQNSELVRSKLEQARELWRRGQERERRAQAREQERARQEQQERERQARRLQELEKGLETVRALAEAAGDEKTRLAIVRTALAEIARSGREKRAEKLETDPWRVCARRAILAAIEGNPALNNTDLTDKVVEGLKTDKIRGRSRRQIERVITDMRGGGIIPPLPPR
jgi:hypothetical protein